MNIAQVYPGRRADYRFIFAFTHVLGMYFKLGEHNKDNRTSSFNVWRTSVMDRTFIINIIIINTFHK